jgi:fatty-acyl-CoA synthase
MLTAEQTLGEALERIARHFPEREAIVSGTMRLTYRQCDDITNLLVTQFEGLGLTKGERVGLMLPTCPQIPLVALALAKIGAVTVLVNPMLQAHETQFVLHDSGASALVVFSRFMNRDMVAMVEDIRPNLPALRHVILVGGRRDGYLSLDEMMAADRPALRPSFVSPDLTPHDLAFLFYTGGTTGSPKGAMSTHHNSLFVESTTYRDKVDKCLCHLLIPPLFMTGGFALLAGVILNGMKLVLLPGFDPRLILQAIQDEKVSYFFVYPTMIRWIMGLPTFDQYDVSSVGEIVVAGEPITPELVRQIKARFGCFVSTGYGMTEARGMTDFPRDAPEELAAISDGRSASHIELRIVDKEGQEVPLGQWAR